MSLYTHDYDPVDTFPVTINTEGEGAAVERLRIDQLLGPSTPLLGLLAAIGAFLIEEYRGAKKRQQDAEAESREAEQAQAERQFKERMTQQEHEFQERMELDRRRFQQEQDERKALQGRLRAKMAFLADIEQLRVLVVDSPAQAARKYLELSIKVPDELLNDVDCRSQLAAMRELLDLSDWRRPLLEEAATHFQEGRDSAALVTTGQLIQLDPQHEPALLLDTVLGFAAKTGEDRKRYLEKHGVSQVIEGLQHIDRQYGNRELGTPIRERVSGLLARLIEAEHIDEVDRLLGFTEQGLDLLREPECQKKLRELSSREDVSPDLTATSKKLISRCEAKVYWVVAWACPRPEVHDVFRSWLELAEFTFNPFGPDMAETDPYLKQFSVNPFEKQITGARPVLVIGKSGAGKTALALMQAHSCNHPLELPQEPSAFPVYYRLVLEDREAWDQRTHLEYIARATSRAIIRYLTLKPNGFLELTPSRREAQVELLLICSGSYERLVRELRQVSEDTVSTRLLRAFEAYRVDVRQPDQVTTQMWLDLLRGSVPAALTRLYVLADVADAWGDNVDDIARRLLSLLSLRTPLEEAGVYLKVFVPERFRAGLGRISGFATATLSWDRNDLYVMLKQRIKQARRDQQSQPSLSAICNPGASGMGVDDLLIAASTTPRDVVHWGNRLLEIHVTRDPDEAYLSEEDVEKWQSELNSAVRANGEGLP